MPALAILWFVAGFASCAVMDCLIDLYLGHPVTLQIGWLCIAALGLGILLGIG